MWYSASTNGAYDDPSFYPDWPSDAVKISDELYAACFAICPTNKVVAPDANGLPELVDRPPVADEVLADLARRKRDGLMRSVYDVGVIMVNREIRLAAGDAEKIEILQAKLAGLDAYADLLLNVPQQSKFPTKIIWPEEPVL